MLFRSPDALIFSFVSAAFSLTLTSDTVPFAFKSTDAPFAATLTEATVAVLFTVSVTSAVFATVTDAARQKFIYTITTKSALKSLRSRSFYLEIMMEHIIDTLLDKLHLSRFLLSVGVREDLIPECH